jgi:hypothetical protein
VRIFPATTKIFNSTIFNAPFSLLLYINMPLSKEARMQMAITAWKQQKVKSKLKAAQIFSVPESSLRKRLSGVKPRTETRANSHKLTATEEETLVKRLLDADKRGFLIRPEFLRGMAQILLRECT